MKGVSESLAGRVAVLTLLPFSYEEKTGGIDHSAHYTKSELLNWILRGGYPELTLNDRVDRELWTNSYLNTYLERDVRSLSNIGDLNLFQSFLKTCAIRTGQLLNASSVAKELGVSSVTVKKWLSILEASHQIYLLPPYFENLGKRLVKNHKLYFLDTALATELIGIHTKTELLNSPHYGALFETMLVNEVLKFFVSAGKKPPLSFLRTHDGLEVDLIIEGANHIQPIEIKSTMTITPNHFLSLLKAVKLFKKPVKHPLLISASKTINTTYKGISEQNWKSFLKKIA
jgi:predicted AAA+ superfamily ATPase